MSKINNVIDRLSDNEFKGALYLLLLVSSGSLILMLVLEYFFDFKPCILCVYQRIPYGLIFIVSLLSLWAKKRLRVGFQIIMLLLIVEVVLASYHVAIERGFIQETKSCSAKSYLDDLSGRELTAALLKKTSASCSKAVYIVPFISIAEMNAIFATSLLFLIYIINRKIYETSRRQRQ